LPGATVSRSNHAWTDPGGAAERGGVIWLQVLLGEADALSVVVKQDGALAWTEEEAAGGSTGVLDYEVHALDKSGSRVLAAGPEMTLLTRPRGQHPVLDAGRQAIFGDAELSFGPPLPC